MLKMMRALGSVATRALPLLAVACALALGNEAAAAVDFRNPVQFDIPPQPLSSALVQFADTVGVQFTAPGESLDRYRSPGVRGTYSPDVALKTILGDTGFTYRQIDAGTVAIGRPEATPKPRASSGEEPSREGKEGKTSSSSAFRVAQAGVEGGAGSAASMTGGDQSPGPKPATLEEVVVTAQKREERLQDVPVPVTAISAGTLVENNQLRIQDYYSSVPGLTMTSQGNGDVTLAIRGITTGYATNPSVGITIDDVPYGSSSVLTNGSLYLPDLDPSDLARVEVLRGPQGTLYGASSIGGLLKFVTLDPSTQGLSGQVQASGNWIRNGAEAGYAFRGSVNVPLGDTFAIRASAFTRRDPGYIDNPTFHIDGVNRADVAGGHFSALWKPSDDLSVKVNALLQNTDSDGNSDVLLTGSGGLTQATLPNSGVFSLRVRLYSATVNARLGGVELTSVTGYGINKAAVTGDSSGNFGGAGGFSDTNFGVTGAVGSTYTETKKFTQEVRLTSSVGNVFDWLAGGFYTHEQSPTRQPIYAADGATGVPVGLLFQSDFPSTFSEAAAFADITIHFTDRFDVQVGGRYSSNRQVYDETDIGPLIPLFFGTPAPLVNPTEHSTDHAVTYLFTPELKITPNLMAYARLASGYRPGGPNADAILFGFPSQYGADKTYNYELGIKGEALDRKLSFDASAYYINWKDIQISLFSATGFVFYDNAGSAKSEGFELSGQARPLSGLTLSAWVSWNEAVLTSDLPAAGTTVGTSGDRLPYSSRWSGNFSAKYEHPLNGTMSMFAGGTVSHVGDREGAFNSVFTPNTPRPVFPAYAKTDLSLGVHYDTWTVTGFVTNVTDRRGVLSNVAFLTNYANYIQPRTAGVSVGKSF